MEPKKKKRKKFELRNEYELKKETDLKIQSLITKCEEELRKDDCSKNRNDLEKQIKVAQKVLRNREILRERGIFKEIEEEEEEFDGGFSDEEDEFEEEKKITDEEYVRKLLSDDVEEIKEKQNNTNAMNIVDDEDTDIEDSNSDKKEEKPKTKELELFDLSLEFDEELEALVEKQKKRTKKKRNPKKRKREDENSESFLDDLLGNSLFAISPETKRKYQRKPIQSKLNLKPVTKEPAFQSKKSDLNRNDSDSDDLIFEELLPIKPIEAKKKLKKKKIKTIKKKSSKVIEFSDDEDEIEIVTVTKKKTKIPKKRVRTSNTSFSSKRNSETSLSMSTLLGERSHVVTAVPNRRRKPRKNRRNSFSQEVLDSAHDLVYGESQPNLFRAENTQIETNEDDGTNIAGIDRFLSEDEDYLDELPTPNHLHVKLMYHQRIALSWMVKQERTHYGGILSDDMGLGKTIESIALFLHNKKDQTLVIAPSSVTCQFVDEVKYRTRGFLNTLLYHGPKRNKRKSYMQNFDVVITSYGTLVTEYKNHFTKKRNERKLSPLFLIKWDRIVLDEGHYIRNCATSRAKACFQLKGRHRWILTGTPVFNSLMDFYALFKFVNYYPYSVKNNFVHLIKDKISNDSTEGFRNFRKILSKIMLRRSKQKKYNGEPIVKLPKKTVDLVLLQFDDDEKLHYESLKKKARVHMNRFLSEGTVMKNYAFILVLLLRLRQCCNHAYLTQQNRTRDTFKKMEKGEDGDDGDGSGVSDNDDDEIIEIDEDADQRDNVCPICLDAIEPNEKVHTKCDKNHHNFCRDCLQGHIDANGPTCPVCRRRFDPNICNNAKSNIKRFKMFSKGTFTHSTKSKVIIEKIKEVLSTTNDKILIISQFTSYLDLLEFPLQKIKLKGKRINYRKLDGRLTLKEKYENIDTLRKVKSCRVALVSLKACSVGLNLNFANQLIMCDHYWNNATESQAIDRIYRLGQKKDVHVYQFMIENSVEERIIAIKKKKQEIANNSFNENIGMVDKVISVEDLCAIFGIDQSRSRRRRGRTWNHLRT